MLTYSELGGGGIKSREPTLLRTAHQRLKILFELLKEEKIKNCARKKEEDFTRKRKMNISEHLEMILTKKGKSLQMELREKGKKTEKKISKQAYSKARNKINPEVFLELNRLYINDIYKTREIKTFYDYLLLAVDGSTNELPNDKELKEYYGESKGRENSVGRVRARTAGIVDCLNHIMIESGIEPYKVSEKEIALRLIKKLKEVIPEEKIILIFDRYYFGVEFVYEIEKLGYKYVMRMRENHYKEEKKEAKGDGFVEIKIRKNSVFYASEENKGKLKEKGKIRSRIIKIEIGEKEEYLATNLGEEELSKEEAKEVYNARWEIEKSYDEIKNKIQIENYSSRNKSGIESEFYAGMLVYNMIEEIGKEAEKKKKRKGKYEYRVNRNIAVGIYRQDIIEIMEIEDIEKQRRAYEKMIEEMAENVVEIKPGRKYERRRMHSMNKYRHNLRRNS